MVSVIEPSLIVNGIKPVPILRWVLLQHVLLPYLLDFLAKLNTSLFFFRFFFCRFLLIGTVTFMKYVFCLYLLISIVSSFLHNICRPVGSAGFQYILALLLLLYLMLVIAVVVFQS